MKVRCGTCDELHDLSDMHLGYDKPDAWYAVRPDERDERWEIGSDLAALDGERFFIRGLLQVPVRGEPEPYAWGVWAAVDADDYHRYDARFDDPEADREPPFPGRIANQLDGYPQTLGVPVTIQLRGGGLRPLFAVDDAAHPLGAEQRDGVYLERVLEMLSPVLHSARPEPRGAPRFATLEEDRWQLLDVKEGWWKRAGSNWFPDEETRSAVPVGALAKLLWQIVASDVDGRAATHVERMWVGVDHREVRGSDVLYSGTLVNDPFNPGLVRYGTRAWFTPAHVADVQASEDAELASARAEVRCSAHGASFAAYVCTHLFHGQDQGFNTADEPENPRPDAWCDRCEAVLAHEGEWNDAAEAFAEIHRTCGTCYDIIEENNRRG